MRIDRGHIRKVVKECIDRILGEAHSGLWDDALQTANDFLRQNRDKVPGLVDGYYFEVEDKPGKGKNKDKTYKSKVQDAPYNYTYRGQDRPEIPDNHRYVAVEPTVGNPKAKEAVKDSSIFSLENSKLGNNTLVFNLTSAMRCPAQGLCKVAAACYAKGMEKRRVNTMKRNLRNENMVNIFEKMGRLDLLFNLIKLHIIDCEQEGRVIDHIRLNEAGDFPSPTLVKAFDKFAGEIKNGIHLDLPGFQGNVNHPITVTAYTAQGSKRFMDAFAGVKHMVVNASLPSIKVGDPTKNTRKFFYAISTKDYKKLPDTELRVTRKGNAAVVKRFPDNLIADGYYYKCPCGIKDLYGMKRQCYNCKICYNNIPAFVDNPQEGEPATVRKFYIVVKAHGSDAGKIDKNSDKINASRRAMGESEERGAVRITEERLNELISEALADRGW